MQNIEEVYKEYSNTVFKYLFCLTGKEETAEDLTQETFAIAIKEIGKFRGDCKISVWLCQIAKNCYYTDLKKSTQTDSIDETELSELPSEEATAEEQLIRQDEASRIRAVLHTLPETYKEVFMWRVFAELSFSQIGQLFGKSDNWACVTYHRAKRMIQERLGDGTDEK